MFNNMDYELFKTYFKLNKKPVELYLACSLNTSTEVINNLSQAINKIKENGIYDKIFEDK